MKMVKKIAKENIASLITILAERKANGAIKEKDRKDLKILKKTPYLKPDDINKVFNLDAIKLDDEVLVIDQVEVLCQLYIKGIKNVTYIQYNKNVKDEIHPVQKKLGYKYINVKNTNEIGKLNMRKQFDVILANPPYDGRASLHQRFFNVSFDMLKDDGVMTFIQPSSPYITIFNESSKNVEDNKMCDIVINNYSTVKLASPTTFENVLLFYPLSITTINKNKPGFKGLDVFTDLRDNTYTNVNINDVNVNETKPELHKVMSEKLKTAIENSAALNDVLFKGKHLKLDANKTLLKLPKVRGNEGKNTPNGYERNKDFFTWIPGNNDDGLPKFDKEKPSDNKEYFGIIIDKDVDQKIAYSYFRTYFARYCMSLGKFNQNIKTGNCIKTTPYFGLHKEWTDEELFKKVGFTDEEIAEVYRIIPSYY